MAATQTKCYCQTLSGEDSAKYNEKIKEIEGVCPYQIPKTLCSSKTEDFPKVNLFSIGWYLVTCNACSEKQFTSAYKSLEAFQAFHCGWCRTYFPKKSTQML